MIFGTNYKSQQVNWAADAAFFQSIGLTTIRPNLASIPVSWAPPGPVTAGSYEYWRNCASFFASAGFFVTWGPAGLNGVSTGTMTAIQWTQYAASVIADATYMQSQGITLSVYELGNEMEAAIDGTTLTIPQLHTNLRALAVSVKAVYTLSPIGYSCFDTGSTTYNDWISTGIGVMDYIGVHPYSSIAGSSRGWQLGGFAVIAKMFNTFGSKCFVSEFNIDATNSNITGTKVYNQVTVMKELFACLKAYQSIPQFAVFDYVGFLNADNQFAMQNIDLSYNQYWNPLLVQGGRTSQITT